MVSVVGGIGLLILLAVNTVVSAVLTRFFRVHMDTRWGQVVYAVVVTPVVLLGLTLVLGTILGPNLGTPGAVFGVTILLPLSVGIAFDYFWMPAPDEVEVPEAQ